MTTRERGLTPSGKSHIVKRPRRSIVTLGLALLGFLVGESSGQRVGTDCTGCLEGPGVVSDFEASGASIALSKGMSASAHAPWLVEAGWSGAYYAPLY